MCIYPFSECDTDISLWDLTGLISLFIYFFVVVLCMYSIILPFHFFGGYNHGPCGCEVGFVTFCLLSYFGIDYVQY